MELARHSDPKLTMNVYTKLGVHDLASALDRLPSLDSGPDCEALQATGTCDKRALPNGKGPAYTPHSSNAIGCDSARQGATMTGPGSIRPSTRKSLPSAKMSDAAQRTTASCDKATRETRTRDLSFTKAPLYQLS